MVHPICTRNIPAGYDGTTLQNTRYKIDFSLKICVPSIRGYKRVQDLFVAVHWDGGLRAINRTKNNFQPTFVHPMFFFVGTHILVQYSISYLMLDWLIDWATMNIRRALERDARARTASIKHRPHHHVENFSERTNKKAKKKKAQQVILVYLWVKHSYLAYNMRNSCINRSATQDLKQKTILVCVCCKEAIFSSEKQQKKNEYARRLVRPAHKKKVPPPPRFTSLYSRKKSEERKWAQNSILLYCTE